jgi:hypothetical protein
LGEAITDDGTEAFARFAKEDAEANGKPAAACGENLAEEVSRQRDNATREHDENRNAMSRKGECSDDAKSDWSDDAEAVEAISEADEDDLSQLAAMSLSRADFRNSTGGTDKPETTKAREFPAMPIIIGE